MKLSKLSSLSLWLSLSSQTLGSQPQICADMTQSTVLDAGVSNLSVMYEVHLTACHFIS